MQMSDNIVSIFSKETKSTPVIKSSTDVYGMTDTRPYIFRAMLEWITDNGRTPHIQVNTTQEGVEIPQHVVGEDGIVVLNISPSATIDFDCEDEVVTFNARFNGQTHSIVIPVTAIVSIFANETGGGMMFE